MTELAVLERRIAEALERIRAGVEGVGADTSADMVPAEEADALASQLSQVSGELEVVHAALTAEKAKTADLNAALIDAQAQMRVQEAEYAAALEQAVTDAPSIDPAALTALQNERDATEAELRTLRASIQDLQSANAELRRAALTGVTDPSLINRSLAADLEAVQAARLGELRDIDAILSALDPIVGGASHA